MFESLSGMELITIAVVALVVFGPARLPEMSRTIGRYVRELRAAARDLREGIEREVAPLRAPVEELRTDLDKPVSDIRQTLAETADAARSADRDIQSSLRGKAPPVRPDQPADASPAARWVGSEPTVGVSPSEAWEGLDDPMPENVVPPLASAPPAEPDDWTAEGVPHSGTGSDGGGKDETQSPVEDK